MKLIVLSYTSKKYRSEPLYIPCDPIVSDRADLTRKLPCMDTWVSKLKEKNIEVIFFDGDNEEIFFDEKNQILHLNENDEYDYFYLYEQKKPSNMLKKFKRAIKWLFENRDFDYILRVDDGTYVNSYIIDKYYDLIKNHDIIWSGQGGGGGIFFSKKACAELLNIDNNFHLEDQSIFNHFTSLPEYKFVEIQSMSAFYNVGEKNLTIHYATGKRMYFIDFLISNYYNNMKTVRKVIINYNFDPNQPLNTNRVNGLNHNTGVWYGMDRDKNNWEYYGNYARSIADIINREITYEDEVMKKLCVFNLYDDDKTKIENTIKNLHKTICVGGEFYLFYNTIIENKHTKKLISQNEIDRIINIIQYLNISYTLENNVHIKKYLDAEYISPEEIGVIIKIIK